MSISKHTRREVKEVVSITHAISEEFVHERAELLPDREAMSLVNSNLALPINAAVSLNALSDGSSAVAIAEQTADINQSI